MISMDYTALRDIWEWLWEQADKYGDEVDVARVRYTPGHMKAPDIGLTSFDIDGLIGMLDDQGHCRTDDLDPGYLLVKRPPGGADKLTQLEAS